MLADSEFRPAWWLPGPHLQTLYPRFARTQPLVVLRRERIELPDGDFVDLDWTEATGGTDPQPGSPIVLILHGLEGSSVSPYAQGMLAAIARHGWQGVVMHFRGCSGEINRLPRSYHSGETGDAAFLIRSLRERYPDRKLAAIGYSLGGNVLLKYLGERGADAELHSAVAISVPFLVSDSAERLNRGFSRFYQKILMQSLKMKTEAKFGRMSGPVSLARLADCQTLREFDDCVTAPLHGFADAADYYARSSCRQYLRGITVPTLVVNARNDPFMTPAALPAASELSAFVRIELSRGGGHVGFVSGRHPGAPRYWLEERVPAFLSGQLA